MPQVSIQDISKKITFVTESFKFLSEKINSAVDSADNGVVNISNVLGEDSKQFMDAMKAMKFSLSAQDVDLQAAGKDKVVVSKLTLESWQSQLSSREREMVLLNLKLENSTVDMQNGLEQELRKLEVDLEGIPTEIPPPAGRSRRLYLTVSTAQLFTIWKAGPEELRYQKLLSGLERQLPGEQYTLHSDSFFFVDPFHAIKREVELTLGKNLDVDSSFKQGFEKWHAETLEKVMNGKTTGRLIEDFYNEMHAGNLAYTRERATFTVNSTLNNKLRDELPKLAKNLLSGSEYEEFQQRFSEKLRRQQVGRMYGSIFALGGFADEAAFAASNLDGNVSTHALKAVQQLASALQVPVAAVWALHDGNRNGKAAREIFNDYFDPRKRRPALLNEIPLQDFEAGRPVHLTGQRVLGNERLSSLLAAAEESRFTKNHARQVKSALKRNAMFVLADLMAFAVDINGASMAVNATALERMQQAVDFVTDALFLGSDVAPIFASGSNVTLGSKAAGVGGAVFSVISSAINIGVVADKYKNDPVRQGREIGIAVGQFASTAALMGIVYAFPGAGMLAAMLIPDFASISRAADLYGLYSDLEKRGLTNDAAHVKTLHAIAALDSTPIINAFGSIYRSVLNHSQRIDPEAVDAYVNETLTQRMNDILSSMSTDLRKYAGEAGVSEFHLLTAMNQVVQYDENVPAGKVFINTTQRTVSSWVDLAVKREQASFDDDLERDGFYWKSSDFRVRNSMVRGGSLGTFSQIKKEEREVTLMDNAAYTMSDWRARNNNDKYAKKSIYVIEKGKIENPAELILDNANSSTDTIYQNAEVSGVRIRSGSGDDVFQLGAAPLELDGGKGTNAVSFALAKNGLTIDMKTGKNINLWIGSKFKNTVIGTDGDDVYRSEDGSTDDIDLGNGDDMAMVGKDAVVKMGAGDDVTFFTGIVNFASGGEGQDIANFQTMKKGIQYETNITTSYHASASYYASVPFMGDSNRRGFAGTGGGSRRPQVYTTTYISGKVTAEGDGKGTLRDYEQFVATDYADKAALLKGDTIKTWSFGAGDDEVTLGSVSDTTVFLGMGNNKLTSHQETATTAYDNVAIHGGEGNDRIELMLNNSRRVMINGGYGNDTISVEAASNSASNKVEIIGGNGDDVIKLKGNVEAVMRFGASDGIDNIYDDIKREKALTLVFDGKLNAADIKTSVLKDDVAKDAAGRVYGYVMEIQGGTTTARLHTYTFPAEILVQTIADSVVSRVDLASLWKPASPATRQASLLVERMASLGGGQSAADTLSFYQPTSNQVQLAVAT
jgi:hypothetical protein